MGRKYEGLDHDKITVKLDAKLSEIVRQYGQDTLKRNPGKKWAKTSDTIRDALTLLGRRMELSDVIENKIADLEDVAKIFDDVPDCEVAARAVREAACVMKVLRDWG